jgi:hypothetical protein
MRMIMRGLMLSAGLLALAACSGGGGGSPSMTGTAGTTTGTTGTTGTSTGFTISAPVTPGLNGNTLPTATASGPNFSTNPPANGTIYPLLQTVTLTTIGTSTVGYTPTSGTTITLQGTQTVNNVSEGLFELKVPSLSLDVPNLLSNGTAVTLADGRQATLVTETLNYSMLALWTLIPGSSSTSAGYLSLGVSGYQTPVSAIPTTGTATFSGVAASGTGAVVGSAIVPQGSGGAGGVLTGNASISVNFQGPVTGALTNMTVTPTGGTASAWNSVNLSGTLSGATVSGSTSVSGTAANSSFNFSGGSSGAFSGALFGPAGQEIGISWTLYDSTGGGKSATGSLVATKQ